jgi:hypothetical protein
MTITESDLPGVGKKFEVDLGDGESLVVLIHNTGKREIYRRPDPDADSEKLFEFTDELAVRSSKGHTSSRLDPTIGRRPSPAGSCSSGTNSTPDRRSLTRRSRAPTSAPEPG